MEPLSRENIADEVRARVARMEAPDPEPVALSGALSPRAQAISDWLMAATIHAPDGTPMVINHALVGNRTHADEYASAIDTQLSVDVDEVALATWMQDLQRGGAYVRTYELAPYIAADLMIVLRDLGHI